MDTTIKVPRTVKAKVMLWTDISYHDMEEIENMLSTWDLERCLCRLLKVDLPEPKRGVLLELYVQSVLFCREHNFSREQTSTFLSIIKSIHDLNVETPFDNIEQCVSYCKELLLCHSVRRPPFSINLFGPEEIKCVFEYIYTSYFKHFKLYKYVFTPEVKLDLSLTYSETVEEEPLQPHTTVNSSEPDVKSEHDGSVDTQQENTGQEEEEEEAASSDPTSEVKALIEQAVRKQIAFVSGELDQRMKDMALQHNGSPQPPQPKNNKKQ
ncbi:cilia- and flagella-associated protein 119 [Gouania willdenowi]|uniref:Coiled-coil domain-containing protein 189-like n=1 Tax=Gouania willdenowi TaxID=441366 RepID=A0A8C5E2S3_GOUWI|nr:coiled-coil domain-containing protein 189-like [Gouania willdenowi]